MVNKNILNDFEIFFKNYSLIIIKVGSSLIVDQEQGKINISWMDALAKDISFLRGIGK